MNAYTKQDVRKELEEVLGFEKITVTDKWVFKRNKNQIYYSVKNNEFFQPTEARLYSDSVLVNKNSINQDFSKKVEAKLEEMLIKEDSYKCSLGKDTIF